MIMLSQAKRLTPAYAGTTSACTRRPCIHRAHPRIRGDHVYEIPADATVLGSPPHTRGPLSNAIRDLWRRGLTPAYAGTTLASPSLMSEMWAHPRIRGDHYNRHYLTACFVGSPPHTRGPLTQHRKYGYNIRLTPAYAGTTGAPRAEKNGYQAHPRIRGDHLSLILFKIC